MYHSPIHTPINALEGYLGITCPRILMHPNWRLEQAGINPPTSWLADDLYYFPSYNHHYLPISPRISSMQRLTTNVKISLHNNKKTSQHCNSTTPHTAATKIIILLNPDSLTHMQANTRTHSLLVKTSSFSGLPLISKNFLHPFNAPVGLVCCDVKGRNFSSELSFLILRTPSLIIFC